MTLLLGGARGEGIAHDEGKLMGQGRWITS